MPWRWSGLCLCLCLWAAPVSAQTADDLKVARTHFDVAMRAYKAGDFAAACRDFQRSFELSRRVDLLYNIGRCREELGQWREALEAYRSYLAGKPRATDRAFVEAHIKGLERTLEAQRRGSALSPASGPVAGPPLHDPPRRDVPWRPPVYAPWIALGVAAAAAGTGLYFGLHTMDRGVSSNSAASAAAPATACFTVAGVAAAAAIGLALWRYLAPRRRVAAGLGPGRLVVAMEF